MVFLGENFCSFHEDGTNRMLALVPVAIPVGVLRRPPNRAEGKIPGTVQPKTESTCSCTRKNLGNLLPAEATTGLYPSLFDWLNGRRFFPPWVWKADKLSYKLPYLTVGFAGG